jgi:hypothetical protein
MEGVCTLLQAQVVWTISREEEGGVGGPA